MNIYSIIVKSIGAIFCTNGTLQSTDIFIVQATTPSPLLKIIFISILVNSHKNIFLLFLASFSIL